MKDNKLTLNEFKVLRYLIDNEYKNQRELVKELDMSLGTVSSVLKRAKDNKLINSSNALTTKGKKVLEPYKVKRAIFMAAGFGSRMVPVTLTTPKPLVEVNGTRIIETLIDALIKNGIEEIYIVRGYLKHKFNELLIKYPNIKFIDNDSYNEANNIYSVILAKNLLENAYLLEADLVLSNTSIIDKYHYSSDFLAIPVKQSDDWCFESKNNIITKFKRGGKKCYQEVGISYWNKEDGKKLAKHLIQAFDMPGGKELLWENVPLVIFNDKYKVNIKECKAEDIIEIDSFKELCDLDKTYLNYKKPEINIDKGIVKNICNVLKCQKDDICNIEYMKIGLTNISFKFSVNGKNYVYRNPGEGTKKFINRKSEAYSEKIAKELGLDDTILWIDENTGWKLSKYVENSTQIDPYSTKDQKAAMKLIRRLHDSKIVSKYDFDYIEETNNFIEMFKKEGSIDFSLYEEIHKRVIKVANKLEKLNYTKVLCHNDYWFWNILKDNKGKLTLIDWEYSGNFYPAADVAYFTSSLEFSNDDYIKLAELYEGHKLNEDEKLYYNIVMAIIMWYWFVWALYKESNGKIIEDKDMWFEKAITALELAE